MKYVPFLTVCDIQGGTQPPKAEWIAEPRQGYVRMLQIRDFTQPDRPKIEYVKDRTSLKKCNANDIMIARYGASLGKILSGLEGAYNVAMAKCFWDKDSLTRDYLLFWLRSSQFQNAINNVGDRAAQAGFNKSDLRELQIPLPPLAEQKRIAAILDAADALRAKRRESLAQLDTLLQSTFLDMFGDPVTNPKGWDVKKLSDVCGKITDGTHHSPPICENGIPYITAKHLKKDGLKFHESPWFVSPKDHAGIFARCNPEPGDVLYIKDGATTGIAAVNRYDFQFSMLSSLALLKPSYEKVTSEYVTAYLNDERNKSHLLGNMGGAAIQRLTLAKIKKFLIPVPPLDLQRRFANIVESVEKQRARLRQHLAELDTLFASLQQRAFAGDL